MEVDRVVCAVATALRNLAIDQRNKELIGKSESPFFTLGHINWFVSLKKRQICNERSRSKTSFVHQPTAATRQRVRWHHRGCPGNLKWSHPETPWVLQVMNTQKIFIYGDYPWDRTRANFMRSLSLDCVDPDSLYDNLRIKESATNDKLLYFHAFKISKNK